MALSASPIRGHSPEQENGIKQQNTLHPPSDESKEADSQDVSQQSVQDEHKWVTGIPLLTILGALCLVCFLMLLDTSIIATVPSHSSNSGGIPLMARCLGHS